MTISMLALAGLPGTAGFIGKFFLIEAPSRATSPGSASLIVIGSMISLVYYLRVIAAIWMPPRRAGARPQVAAPVIAGGSPEADPAPGFPDGPLFALPVHPEVVAIAVLMGAATLFFGIIPGPLLDVASDAASSLGLG